jgi:circadian clock protein KaiB
MRVNPSTRWCPMTDAEVEASGGPTKWQLRLYVAGQSPKSMHAVANLKRLCDDHLPGAIEVEIVDLVENPERARGDGILAIPTLVRRVPQPTCRFIGDLSNTARVLAGLGVDERGA